MNVIVNPVDCIGPTRFASFVESTVGRNVGDPDSKIEGLSEDVSVGEADPTTGDREGVSVGLGVGDIVGSLCLNKGVNEYDK